MARKHRFSIVLMLGAAVVAGFLALSRSVQLGAASKPAATRSGSPGVLYVRSPASPVAATHGDDEEHDAEAHGGGLGEAGGDD
jgi:hypothetical protein